MKRSILKLITRYNPHHIIDPTGAVIQYDFTMYRREIYYCVHPFESQYGGLNGFVEIEAYGLIVREVTTIGGVENTKEWDNGLLTACQHQMSELLYFLCNLKVPDIQKVETRIAKKVKAWSDNRWGSAFGKVAHKKLCEKYSSECEVTALPPTIIDSAIVASRQRKRMEAVSKLRAYWDKQNQ